MTYPLSRRTVVKGLALFSAATVLVVRRSAAAEPAKLSVTDPAAVALGYVENAAQVDVKKYPSFVKGSTCENCLQLQGKSGEAFRPCSLFKDKVVSANGWCSGWTPEM
jgi:High potential iron-sulfur protein